MRLLANENFPGLAVAGLRNEGHDVLWIRESFPGISDENVLAMAVAEQRILLTFDKDFGELAFRARLPSTCGIVLFRFRKQSPEVIASRAISSLAARQDWSSHFSVIEEDRFV